MLNRITHIVLFLFISLVSFGQLAQPGWNVVTADSSTFYKINTDSIFENGMSVDFNDYIGVFYKKLDQEYCAGFAKTDSVVTEIEIHFFDFSFDSTSLQSRDSIYFMHWDFSEQCTYKSTLVNNTIKKVLLNSVHTEVESLYSASLNTDDLYDQTYVNNGQTIIPTSVNFLDEIQFNFSSNDVLVDSISGNINLALVPVDFHEVKITSDICLSQTLFTLDVTEPHINSGTNNLSERFLSFASSDPQFNQALIETSSDEIKIYDKSGRLIISSPETFNWDGRDQYGRLVPADNYYIKIGEEVTVIIVIQ